MLCLYVGAFQRIYRSRSNCESVEESLSMNCGLGCGKALGAERMIFVIVEALRTMSECCLWLLRFSILFKVEVGLKLVKSYNDRIDDSAAETEDWNGEISRSPPAVGGRMTFCLLILCLVAGAESEYWEDHSAARVDFHILSKVLSEGK